MYINLFECLWKCVVLRRQTDHVDLIWKLIHVSETNQIQHTHTDNITQTNVFIQPTHKHTIGPIDEESEELKYCIQ